MTFTRLPWGRRSSDNAAFSDLEVDAALRMLGAVQPEPGIEARVIAGVQARSSRTGTSAVRRAAPASWFTQPTFRSSAKLGRRVLGGWTPWAVAASMACLLAGGAMIDHVTSIEMTQQAHARVLPRYAFPPAGQSTMTMHTAAGGNLASAAALLTGSGTLQTAAARRRPALPVPAGQRRGRSRQPVTVNDEGSTSRAVGGKQRRPVRSLGDESH